MERILHRLAVSALVCAAPAVASAGSLCGGSTFSTCASAHVTKTLLRNGSVRVRVQAMHVAGLGEARSGGPFTRLGSFRMHDDTSQVDAKPAMDGNADRTDVHFASHNDDDDANDEAKPRRKSGPSAAGAKEARTHSRLRAGFHLARPRAFEFDLAGGGGFREFEKRGRDDDDGKRDRADKNDAKREACSSDDGALCEAVLTPEPSSLVLLVTALAGLTAFGLGRRPRV